MSLPKNEAWFAAKRYGYGWGLPLRWQGWAVMVGFLVAVVGGTPLAASHPIAFAIYMTALGAALVVICAWKGEPARWRWGKKDES